VPIYDLGRIPERGIKIMPEIECTECGWTGDVSDLLCSDEDFRSTKSILQIDFNICPECGAVSGSEDYED
jgi:NMD protein affecting ribosome stability and mRNA decay